MSEFNLITEKWIPVLYRDGRFDRVGIKAAFAEAANIRQVAASNPLDLFAIHRFLLTLLYWKADLVGGVASLRATIWEQMAIPENVLIAIQSNTHRFNLFDKEIPFLQDPTHRNPKPDKSPGYLFAEFATGINIAHFHHGDDTKMELCLDCVVGGMLRVIPWSQAGGRSIPTSIHGNPPIMALALGDNLAETLGMNLVPLDGPVGEPKWSGHFQPIDKKGEIPYMEALTWNPRLIWLPAPQLIERCWKCGAECVKGVGKIVFKMNKETLKLGFGKKKDAYKWIDPAAFYDSISDTKKDKETGEEVPKDLNQILQPKVSSGKSDILTSEDLFGLTDNKFMPQCRLFLEYSDHDRWLLVVPTTDGKAKTFDHRSIELDSLNHQAIKEAMEEGRRSRHSYQDARLKGWSEPKGGSDRQHLDFITRAIECLDDGDWAVLSGAAFRSMNDAIAAFDRLTGIYWSFVRNAPKPSRNAAWLTLKLMASVPSRFRQTRAKDGYSPLSDLPKQQLQRKGRNQDIFQYPLALPRGERLESALRSNLARHIIQKNPKPIDWAGLCHALDQLLN